MQLQMTINKLTTLVGYSYSSEIPAAQNVPTINTQHERSKILEELHKMEGLFHIRRYPGFFDDISHKLILYLRFPRIHLFSSELHVTVGCPYKTCIACIDL